MDVIIALNHKSNLGKQEYTEYLKEISSIETSHQLILCPSFINIGECHPDNITLGAQNVSTYESGAHTGEISASQLKSYGVKYVIVGHSERRKDQKENLETIHQKLIRLLETDITPILCIGETKEERATNKVEEVLQKEVTSALAGLTKEDQEKIIIAYEPIWSIGTGLIPSNSDIKKTIGYIKQLLPTSKVLYGGSANEENIDIIKRVTNIDGYLLGGLSLQPEKLKLFVNKLN